MKRIGLLGCGAIGTEIALAIDSGKVPAKLTHVYDFSKTASTTLVNKLKNRPQITENATLLAASPVDLIVAALLSLTGLGSQKTRVKIIADPSTDKNVHEIQAQGKFGRFFIKVDNVPSENNPKTSRLAILSAVECLRKICGNDIQIGT